MPAEGFVFPSFSRSLTDLPVCPYGIENLCKYLGRCLSGHQTPLKKPVAIFSLFSDENVKFADMG